MRRLFTFRFARLSIFAATAGALGLAASLGGCRASVTEAGAARTVSAAASYPSAVEEGSNSSAPYTPISADGFPNGGPPNPTPVAYQRDIEVDEASKPNITGKAAILVDEWGRVLYEKNADTRLPAASTQKLLLGILIVENGNLSQKVTVADSDTWAEPTKMGIKTGQTYTREELLLAVLVRSSNDIARALARDHSGSEAAFAANMNRRARELGMHNSYFTNASGLPTPAGQYSTARDLAILGNAALKKPFIRDAVRTKSLVFRFADGTTKSITNTNALLKSRDYCTGCKTGYTHAAGKCLVSSASANGKNVLAVILGSKTPTIWDESDALLRYGLKM